MTSLIYSTYGERTNRIKAVFRVIIEKSFSESDFTDSGKPTEEIPRLNHFWTSWIRKRILQIFKGETWIHYYWPKIPSLKKKQTQISLSKNKLAYQKKKKSFIHIIWEVLGSPGWIWFESADSGLQMVFQGCLSLSVSQFCVPLLAFMFIFSLFIYQSLSLPISISIYLYLYHSIYLSIFLSRKAGRGIEIER